QKQEFSLLNPELSKLTYDQLKAGQKFYAVNYLPLKKTINETVKLPSDVTWGLYFENLNSGTWIGINERTPFYSGSLRKIPLLAAVLQEVNEERLSLETPIKILPEDINSYSGILYTKSSGYSLTVAELMNYTVYYSDNTAANALLRTVGSKKIIDIMFNLGFSYTTYLNNKDHVELYPLSAKEFSNSFKSLYYSNTLRRKHSQYILDLLTHTSFTKGLPAGVPFDIPVAHKTAYTVETAQHHDCGIVYYPHSPYILCIMTKGMTQEEADQFISRISKITYEYVKHTES
ncbi:MAG: serine hydrolase, partial [Nanoarchaeota archaeon]